MHKRGANCIFLNKNINFLKFSELAAAALPIAGSYAGLLVVDDSGCCWAVGILPLAVAAVDVDKAFG